MLRAHILIFYYPLELLKMIEKNYKQILILEDDVRFNVNFKENFLYFMNQLKDEEIKWELL